MLEKRSISQCFSIDGIFIFCVPVIISGITSAVPILNKRLDYMSPRPSKVALVVKAEPIGNLFEQWDAEPVSQNEHSKYEHPLAPVHRVICKQFIECRLISDRFGSDFITGVRNFLHS